ncbi:hypothetical protein BKA93DRAFT_516511 [Sparassis latifolia]
MSVKEQRCELREEMHAKFVLMPVDEFMDDFVPNFDNPLGQQKPDFINAFKNMPGNDKREFELYKPLVDCVEDANLCPGHTLRLVQNKADPDDPSRQKVDAALFRTPDNVPADGRPHWALQNLSIEFKRHRNYDDPFEEKKRRPKRVHKATKVRDVEMAAPEPEQSEDLTYMTTTRRFVPGDSLTNVVENGPHDMSRFALLNGVWVLKKVALEDEFSEQEFLNRVPVFATGEDIFDEDVTHPASEPPSEASGVTDNESDFHTASEGDDDFDGGHKSFSEGITGLVGKDEPEVDGDVSRTYKHFYPSVAEMVDTQEDFFQTPPTSSRAEDNAKAIFKTAPEADARRRTAVRGQIISYAKMIFSRQHRCFVFTVLILGDCVRIIRWDHAGAIVTHKFNYMTTEHLGEFLWRFSHMTDEQQGYDMSAVPVVPGSADYELMSKMAMPMDPPDPSKGDYARRSFVKSLDLKASNEDGPDEWLCWKFTIVPEKWRQKGDVSTDRPIATDANSDEDRATPPSNVSEMPAARHFLVGKPHFESPGMTGRFTRCYIAVDCEGKKFVFLKDVWRVDLEDIEMEGRILQTLNKEGVENIPTLECHGDVEGRYQQTKHAHYRLVVEEICRPLKDFRNSRELVKIIAECIDAHWQATDKAKYAHRDVSTGNLLMHEKMEEIDGEFHEVRTGMLCDWELSKRIEDEVEEQDNNPETGKATQRRTKPRQPDRTGTWQFMSVLLLDFPWKEVTIPDELEAFFNVLLFHIVRYTDSSIRNAGVFMSQYFDESMIDSLDVQYTCGSVKRTVIKTGMLAGRMEPIKFKDHKGLDHIPLNNIVECLLKLFKAHYTVTLPDLLLQRHPTEDQRNPSRVHSEQETLNSSDSAAATDENTKTRSIQDLLAARAVAKLEERLAKHSKKNSRKQKSPGSEGQALEQALEMENAAAERLKTQEHVYSLLINAYANEKWPEHDKVDDRVPSNYSYADYRERGLKFPPAPSSSSGSESPSEARPTKRPRLPVQAASGMGRGRPSSSYARRRGKQPGRLNASARRL